MQDLIERLEKATGPDTELDHAIMLAVSGAPPAGVIWSTDREYTPAYTASLDAAMTLVPEGRDFWDVGTDPGMGRHYTADVSMPALVNGEQGCYCHHAKGASPALALCIAALKARA